MKKVLNIVAALGLVAGMTSSCDLLKLDNYDGPNAQVHGQILDQVTKEPIQVEACLADNSYWDWNTWQWVSLVDYKGGVLYVTEDVTKIPDKDKADKWAGASELQYWWVKFTGEYRNNMTFAGEYDIDFRKLPVFQDGGKERIVLKEGDNEKNFEKLPYCRIKDVSFTWQDNKVIAKFKVEAGDAARANAIRKFVLCSSTSNFVSDFYSMTKTEVNNLGEWWAPGPNYPMGQEITIELDTTGKEEFTYSRDHYLRIGVVAGDYANAINPDNIYNYCPIYKMDKNHSISLYDWSTAKQN